ncbi:MAG: DNA repair protein RecO [Acidiferrobacteraceae bacterium]|nr:DNA repair protein RecO [Acidiferrobacteraceae bacterium]
MDELRRVFNERAYVLHQRAYSETSLLLDIFSERHGRVALIAKGVKQKKSRILGILGPFQEILCSWSGRGEIKTLTGADAVGRREYLGGSRIFCGYYINELILRMLHREEPHQALFEAYRLAIQSIPDDADVERTLRIFEKHLLRELGYGLHLNQDSRDSSLIDPDTVYCYVRQVGPIAAEAQGCEDGVLVHGESLLALRDEQAFSDLHRKELKRLTRFAINENLDGKRLRSRDMFYQLFTGAQGKLHTVSEKNV